MTIDEAIENLKDAKKQGVKNIVLAWWAASMFDREDDDEWAADVEQIDDNFDWSSTQEDILMSLEELATNEEDADE